MSDHQQPLLRSESGQNFLKSVYALQQEMERVSTNALADVLGISAPSVTDMAQRLEEAGLLDYQKYRGVVLTDRGQRAALQIIRRHRLIELYLVEQLGYALHEVHDEAENLEHAVSDRFVEAVSARLGHPLLDPHGDPIPAEDGTIAHRDLRPLADWPLHRPAAIAQIRAASPAMLEYIIGRGIALGTPVEVLARDPFDGPITLLLGGREQIIGHNVAACLLIEDAPAAPPDPAGC
jgi:DtxR family Mn-dependent transcriptional regulator